MSAPDYTALLSTRGAPYRASQVLSHSHYDTPIPDGCTTCGNSRVWGDASKGVQTQAIDAPMRAGGNAVLGRVEMRRVKSGQIRLGQMDCAPLRVAEVDTQRAANTAPEQVTQALSAADQQAQAQALEREQHAHAQVHNQARSGPVLA